MDALTLVTRFGHSDPPDPSTLDAVAGMVAALEQRDADRKQSAALPDRRPTRLARRVVGVAAAIAVAAVGLTVASSAGVDPPAAGAATFFRSVAHVSAAQPGGWPTAAYWYSESRYWQLNNQGQRKPTETRQVWIGHDGTGLINDPAVGTMPLTGHDNSDNPSLSTAGFGGKPWTWDQLYALPTDPRSLAPVLRASVVPTTQRDTKVTANELVYDTVLSLLTDSPASPALRSALYGVAAQLPGAIVDGQATDSIGRQGVAVKYPATGGHDDVKLIIDPTTGQLLEEKEIITADSATVTMPPGTVVYETTYVNEGPATRVGITPDVSPS